MHVYSHTYRCMLYVDVRRRSEQAEHQKSKKTFCKTEVSNCRKLRRFLAFPLSHFSRDNFCKEFFSESRCDAHWRALCAHVRPPHGLWPSGAPSAAGFPRQESRCVRSSCRLTPVPVSTLCPHPPSHLQRGL